MITIEYDFIYSETGTIGNTATATAKNPASPDDTTKDLTDTDNTIVDVENPLVVEKIVSDELAYIGDEVNYIVNVTNNGSAELVDIEITDTIFKDIDNKEDIVLLKVDVPVEMSRYEWEADVLKIHSMEAGEIITIRYSFIYNDNTNLIKNNMVTVTTQNPADPDKTLTDTDETEKDINTKPEIIVNKKADSDIGYVGKAINYTITIQNTGTIDNFENVKITDEVFGMIDDKSEIILKSSIGTLSVNNDYKWNGNVLTILDILANEKITIEYAYTPIVAGNYKNVVVITTTDPLNPDESIEKEAEENTEILKAPSIIIAKTSDINTADINSPINYTITAQNDGGVDLTQINITDTVFNLINHSNVVIKKAGITLKENIDYIWNGNILVINSLAVNEILEINYEYIHSTAEAFENVANASVKNPLNPDEELNSTDNDLVDIEDAAPEVTTAPTSTPTAPTATPTVLPTDTPTVLPTTAPTSAPPAPVATVVPTAPPVVVLPVLPTIVPTETPEAVGTQTPNPTVTPLQTPNSETQTPTPNITPIPPTAEVKPDGGVEVETQLPDVPPDDVTIDGNSLDENLYEFDDGVLTILPEAFENLGDGEHEVEIKYEDGESIITNVITDQGVPLSAGVAQPAWSLFDLIMTIIAFILMLLYILSKGKKEEKEDREVKYQSEAEEKAKKRKLAQIMTVIIFLISLILLLITQDFTLPMTIFDEYSIAFAIISIVQLLIVVAFRKSKNEEEPEKV